MNKSFMDKTQRHILVYSMSISKYNDAQHILDFYENINMIVLTSKNSSLLQMKLKWYIDSIKSNEKTYHEITDNFLKVLNNSNMKLDNTLEYIVSKNKDLDEFPFKDLSDLINYLTKTESVIWHNVCRFLKNSELTTQEKIFINNLAINYGLITLINNNYIYNELDSYPLIYGGNDFSTNKVIILNYIQENSQKTMIFYKENKSNIFSNIKSLKVLNNFVLANLDNIKESYNFKLKVKHKLIIFFKLLINLLRNINKG